MIKLVETRGFKGEKKCTYDLTGLDLLAGDNGAGKSTLIQAIQFALTGKIPGVGEKNQELIKFSNESDMEVTVFLDNGIVTRRLYLDGITIKESVECDAYLQSGTLAEKNRAILENTIGLPITLNFGEFVGMKDKEKREFIYSLLTEMGKYNKETTVEYILAKGFNNQEVLNRVMDNYKESDSIEQALEKMLNHISTEKKLLNAEYKKVGESIKQMTYMRNQEVKSMRGLEELKVRKVEITNQILNLERLISENNQKFKTFNEFKEKKVKLTQEISILETKANCTKGIDIQGEILKLENQYKNIEKDIEAYEVKKVEIEGNIQKCTVKMDKIVEQGTQIKSNIDHKNSLITNIKNSGGCCSIDKSIKCTNNFTHYMTVLSKDVKEFESVRQDLLSDYKNLQEQKKLLETSKAACEASKKDMTVLLMKTNNEINSLKIKASEYEMSKREIAIKKELLDDCNKNLTRYGVINSDTNIKQKDILNKSLIEINNEISQFDEVKANEIILEKTKLQYKEVEKKISGYKEIEKIVGPKGLQGEIVKSGLGTIEDEVNNSLNILDINAKVFFECNSKKGAEVFNFGILSGDSKKYFEGMSQGEKLMLSIAIMNSIITRINSVEKVLVIDDLIHLDKKNRMKLYQGLINLKHVFTNIIAMGAINDDEISSIPTDIKVWNMSKSTEFEQLSLNITA